MSSENVSPYASLLSSYKIDWNDDRTKMEKQLNGLTIPKLKDILRELKCKLSGKKSELIDRLLDRFFNSGPSSPSSPSSPQNVPKVPLPSYPSPSVPKPDTPKSPSSIPGIVSIPFTIPGIPPPASSPSISSIPRLSAPSPLKQSEGFLISSIMPYHIADTKLEEPILHLEELKWRTISAFSFAQIVAESKLRSITDEDVARWTETPLANDRVFIVNVPVLDPNSLNDSGTIEITSDETITLDLTLKALEIYFAWYNRLARAFGKSVPNIEWINLEQMEDYSEIPTFFLNRKD